MKWKYDPSSEAPDSPPQDEAEWPQEPQQDTLYQPEKTAGEVPAAIKKEKRRKKPLEIALVAISVTLLVMVALSVVGFFALSTLFGSLSKPLYWNATTPNDTFSVVQVVGDIFNIGSDGTGANEPSYHHASTVNYVKQLADNPNDKGILLYMNTGGGGVYESDELYNALIEYKEKTERPVWAYMGDSCASGGYYVTMAADKIIANPNTTTGSIGVYIALTDTSALYEKLGIETVLIGSGDNKGVGVPGVEITEAQQDIYQGIVEEKHERFESIVAQGRGLDKASVANVADGRPFTAKQAQKLKLIDDIGNWDEALAAFEEHTGYQPFYPNFSKRTALGNQLSSVRATLPLSDNEVAMQAAEQLPSGVPLYYVPAL